MSSVPPRLVPVNRHVLIVPHTIKKQENKSESGVLLPDDYKPKESRYVTATVLDVSEDCNAALKKLKRSSMEESRDVIIERSMIEEVSHKDKNYYLILENYVVGMLRG